MTLPPKYSLCLAAFTLLATPVLLAAPALSADTDLIGTSWVLEDLGGTPVAGDPPTTLAFGDDGSASGQGGCNGYGGTTVIEGDSIAFENVISTMMACDEPIMSQEQGFFKALEDATAYHVSDGTLFLLDDAGNKLATLATAQ